MSAFVQLVCRGGIYMCTHMYISIHTSHVPMSFISSLKGALSPVLFAMMKAQLADCREHHFSVCDILPCHSPLQGYVQSEKFKRWLKQVMWLFSHWKCVWPASGFCCWVAFVNLWLGLFVLFWGLCSKWLKASPARPLVSLLSCLHPQPLSMLLSNLLLSVLGLYIAPPWLGYILSIKRSKDLHSPFWVTLPEPEGWIREDSTVKEGLTGTEQREHAVCGGGVLAWWHGTSGTGCFLFESVAVIFVELKVFYSVPGWHEINESQDLGQALGLVTSEENTDWGLMWSGEHPGPKKMALT